ncbi:hypothetical protein K493DRAFT_76772 [Basidiobolus meristosporus CBS 931.73]|uniref:Uncharacterized protein n=1 Tax=Basidiobolus meristosporus CBS 931.73 TaxID=1314790 RepID=A0A1Y1XS94_9FUNG|nr:hypothetical protein K493DRAFT_76772 [Basidiobolus meristosporus CBS 931.73]|eukprot:ORX88632.1 hypothetical protein K493DRAFT_76772 [Basidiobolus meristosporus CBS 931.73]
MDSLSLERVITVGDRKLTDMYRSTRDLGISKEVVLKGFLRKARDISELQKQIPLNLSHSKYLNDTCTYENSLPRSPIGYVANTSTYNEIMFNMMNSYMYTANQPLETGSASYVNNPVSSMNPTISSMQGYSSISWPLEQTADFSFNSSTDGDFISDLSSATIPQTDIGANSIYSFEQNSYYNYSSVQPSTEGDGSTDTYLADKHELNDVESGSCESTPPFYSELSKALLLNESSEAQSSIGSDKRKRCYEEADIEAQIHQTKRLATV